MTARNGRGLTYTLGTLTCLGIFFALRLALTGSPPGPDDEVLAIAVQSGGRAVLGGRFSGGRIERLNADGTVDETFRASWTADGFNAAVRALAVQTDDRVIAGGDFTSFDTAVAGHIARLNADGSLDTAFANAIGTGFNDAVTSLALQADGKILAGGAFDSFNGARAIRLARLNPDGTLDPSLGADPGAAGPVRALAFDPTLGLVAAGEFDSFLRR